MMEPVVGIVSIDEVREAGSMGLKGLLRSQLSETFLPAPDSACSPPRLSSRPCKVVSVAQMTSHIHTGNDTKFMDFLKSLSRILVSFS
jgi:hypothetical protein